MEVCMPRRAQPRKVRVTAALDAEMLKTLDRVARQQGLSSRSQALEAALAHWLKEQARRRIENETEAYYRGLNESERREDREWTNLASRAAARLRER
jgi:metal-responsive CopG/Arc/MetJ family transcriptional regulator